MNVGRQHWLFHFIKATALIGIGFGVLFALFLTVMEISTSGAVTPESERALTMFFDFLGVTTVAIFAWAFIEFTAGVWSIGYVRSAANRARRFLQVRYFGRRSGGDA